MRRSPRRAILTALPFFLMALWATADLRFSTLSPRTAAAQLPIPPIPQIPPNRGPFPVFTKPTFTMVTLGDSIMWGQGLPEGRKFRNIVAQWLQTQYGSTRIVKQFNRAHSGAEITVDASEGDTETGGLSGEIPSGHPSILKQVDLMQADLTRTGIDPSTVDLVLLNGGINDVGVFNILWPTNSTGKVRALADANCVGRMGKLLPYVMSKFPTAAIVVTGYYSIASPESDMGALTALVTALGAEAGVDGAAAGLVLGALSKDQIVNNSAEWSSTSRTGLSSLIDQNQPSGSPRLALAWPSFPSESSYAAPNTYLWTLGQFAGDETRGVTGKHTESQTTPNGVAYTRAQACAASNRASPKCLDASMGHPNEQGGRAYADSVILQLQNTLWARLGLPHMTAEIADSGEGKAGTHACWVVVKATDSRTGAPVRASVTVGTARASSGERVTFRCTRWSPRTTGGQPANGRRIVREPFEDAGRTAVVSAPGYNQVDLTFGP